MPPARRSARAVPSSQPYPAAHRANTRLTSSASIARPANGKLKLTVKAPPSKLRQATSGSQFADDFPPNPYADATSESDATPQPPPTRVARTTRNPRTVIEPDSDEDAEEDEDEDAAGEEDDAEEDMDDAEADVDQEILANEDSEEDAEGEEDDEEEMDELDQHPPAPVIKQRPAPASKGGKPSVTVTAPPTSHSPLKSVEAREMELDRTGDLDDDDDDEELSELDDDDENEGENDEEEEDSDMDEDDEDGSRAGTPDLSKLTRRQRGLFDEDVDTGLMALSNEAQKKKHLTAEEHAMRRAEMARRRKNLSEKRNEEEKVNAIVPAVTILIFTDTVSQMETINKLLKKPAPKRRTRAEMLAQQHADMTPGDEDDEDYEVPPADPLFVRYTTNRWESHIAVPQEWLEVGAAGQWMAKSTAGKLAQEVT